MLIGFALESIFIRLQLVQFISKLGKNFDVYYYIIKLLFPNVTN